MNELIVVAVAMIIFMVIIVEVVSTVVAAAATIAYLRLGTAKISRTVVITVFLKITEHFAGTEKMNAYL